MVVTYNHRRSSNQVSNCSESYQQHGAAAHYMAFLNEGVPWMQSPSFTQRRTGSIRPAASALHVPWKCQSVNPMRSHSHCHSHTRIKAPSVGRVGLSRPGGSNLEQKTSIKKSCVWRMPVERRMGSTLSPSRRGNSIHTRSLSDPTLDLKRSAIFAF